ncbi:MAG: nucleotide exchange factor GrpE [Gammaproteobacteria bacterium]|nr:nucleotide exchange factor GrpE [Gammaproteobacteria bacterium]
MAEESHKQDEAGQDDAVEEIIEPGSGSAEANNETVNNDIDSLQDALDEATAQASENWDKFMRSQAEMDNILKRTKRDLENAHKFALEKFVNELLSVRDSLEMGLDHAEGEDVDPVKLKEGSELTLRMLSQVMEKFNVIQVDPRGETFNPELHEAMAMVPSNEVAPNNILDVIQKGYLLNDRLIRPARVVVAKALDE